MHFASRRSNLWGAGPIMGFALVLLIEVVAPCWSWAQAATPAPPPTASTVSQELPPIQEVEAIEDRRPFYKKWWFWTIVAVAVGGAAVAMAGGGGSNGSSSTSTAPAGPGNVNVKW